MRDVYDFAKFFIKNGIDSTPNTFDGNMKLQKMLVLADMSYISRYKQPLFKENVLAFKNGLVVEKVRLRYKNDYFGFKKDSDQFDPDFNENEYEILRDVIGVYGHLSAKELSALNHTFKSWNQAYQDGMSDDGYHIKERSIVDFSVYPEDIDAVGRSIKAYRETMRKPSQYEIINGVVFYYNNIAMTDELISILEDFSKECDDDAYSVCEEDGRLVIY